MPASTFTMAVGHWRQVTTEIPPELEEHVNNTTDWGKTGKPRAGLGQWTEAELVSGAGSSTSEVVKDSPLHTGRYFIIFPVLFSSPPSSGPKTFHGETFLLPYPKWSRGEVRGMDRVQHYFLRKVHYSLRTLHTVSSVPSKNCL